MKKIFTCLAIVIASITTALIVESNYKCNDLLSANVEALADPETPNGYTPGYKSDFQWVLGGIAITWPPVADVDRILCCVSSRQMDACDFSKADPRCK